MYRALVQVTGNQQVSLSKDELHHLTRVRRLRTGETFVGLDGKGSVYLCRLEGRPHQEYGRILQIFQQPGEDGLQLTLAQALLKKDKFDWVLQKSTELGVHRIVPLVTARTELRLEGQRETRRKVRWLRVVQEAMKQCGRSCLPVLEDPLSLEELLSKKECQLVLALDENGDTSLKAQLQNQSSVDSCLVLVGPEGGWDDQDRLLLDQRRIPRIHLGPRILRAETAPVVILSILQFELGDFS